MCARRAATPARFPSAARLRGRRPRACRVQQDLLQTTLGKGLGMIYCRHVLDRDYMQLSALGTVFLYVMIAQAICLAVGWEPLATLAKARKVLPAWVLRPLESPYEGVKGGELEAIKLETIRAEEEVPARARAKPGP